MPVCDQHTPRHGHDLLPLLAARLTARDRWILRMLHEHKVFTTTQLADLAFARNTDTADHRLLKLTRLHVLQRIRPFRPSGGSAPCHWLLATAGAEAIAAERGITLKELGYRRDRATAVMLSAKLDHHLGTNGFFIALAAHPDRGRLEEWWPEAQCAKTWGKIVCPDGYGRWTADGTCMDFFLEYDNATESLPRVTAKIGAYTRLTHATGITSPLLIYFTSARRETGFRRECPPSPVLPVLTASAGEGPHHPAAAIWARLGTTDRRPLADFAPPATTQRQGSATDHPETSAWVTRPPQLRSGRAS
jgi:Replication-relaxation